MDWMYLVIAAIFEMGWPLGFKISQMSNQKALWIGISAVSMGLSGVFLWIAQKSIPIGTAYAVWTGIGAIGTFAIGILFFRDPVNLPRLISAMLIISGLIGLRLSS